MTLNGHLVLNDWKINTGHIIISVFGLSSVLQGSQSSVVRVFSSNVGRTGQIVSGTKRSVQEKAFTFCQICNICILLTFAHRKNTILLI